VLLVAGPVQVPTEAVPGDEEELGAGPPASGRGRWTCRWPGSGCARRRWRCCCCSG